MDMELLRTFLEVNRTRHFGEAAEALHLQRRMALAKARKEKAERDKREAAERAEREAREAEEPVLLLEELHRPLMDRTAVVDPAVWSVDGDQFVVGVVLLAGHAVFAGEGLNHMAKRTLTACGESCGGTGAGCG